MISSTLLRFGLLVALVAGTISLPLAAQTPDPLVLEDGGLAREFVVAESRARTATAPAEMVLYEKDAPQNATTRRVLRTELAVQLAAGTTPEAVAAAAGLTWRGKIDAAPGWHLFSAADPAAVLAAAGKLKARAGVLSAQPQLARQQQKRLVPTDPLFANQWHLASGGVLGTNVNVQGVWDNFRGAGVRIGIVDDGLQTTHEDLVTNVDTVNDHDWNDASPDDPNPDTTVDFHGTACAGVAAARQNNAKGLSGSAPEATLVGLRLIAAVTTDTQEAEAMGWKNDLIFIKSNSWGPSDTGTVLEGPGPMTTAALKNAAETGRGGKGTIFTWAGGNGGSATGTKDNSNYDGYANSIYTIAIGATTNTGVRASYSEPGANLVVSAPSSGGSIDIYTVDLTGTAGYNDGATSGEPSNSNYTSSFGGTSSATPLAAGCIALLLQAYPNLGWRDVQEILIRSAAKINPTETDWVNNGAGFHFNHNFGAGVIDTQAALALAATWTNLGPQQSRQVVLGGLPLSIPDNNTAGLVQTFAIPAGQNIRVEQVTLLTTINHTNRGQLAVTLTSPQGTVSRLAEKHTDSGDNYASWTFSSVRNWGENAAGTWTLTVADLTSGTTGTLAAATLTVYGTTAGPVDEPPSISAATVTPAATAFFDETLTVGGVVASDPEGQPVTFFWQWQASADGTTFTDLAGATASTLALGAAQTGQLVRCRVTPRANALNGAAFLTGTVAVNRRPGQFARRTQAYSYDSDLFVRPALPPYNRSVIINEFSQGPSLAKEWVELLTLKTADLRGCKLGDKSGTYTTFQNTAFWQAVPAGTLIVIYNAADRDAAIPGTLDLDPADGVLIIPHNNTTVFTPGPWNGLSNSSADRVVLTDPAGNVLDGVSFFLDNVYDPKLGSVGAAKEAFFNGGAEAEVEDIAHWTIGAAGSATPAAANGSANLAFINEVRSASTGAAPQFRFGLGSAPVAGLTLNALTGVLGGTVTAPAGVYALILERYTGTEVVNQSFSLFISDLATDRTDTDGDGFLQLAELALGLDPTKPDVAAWPVFVGEESGHAVLTFSRPAGITGPTYTVQVSPNLINWFSGSSETVVLSDVVANGRRTIRVQDLSSDAPRRFVRLLITAP